MEIKYLDEIKAAIALKPRHFVTWQDVEAVIQQETSGVPIFNPNETLYKLNLLSAENLADLPPAVIKQSVTIIQGPLEGKICKFRMEPGYWRWADSQTGLDIQLRVLLACSLGVGQKMARWLITNVPKYQWGNVIRHFMADVPTQLLYVAGDLDNLLLQSEGDRLLAYTRYNAGAGAKTVSKYGRDVFNVFEEI